VSQNSTTVSIDKGFAETLGGVALGDTVTVFIQGVTLTATITSIREVDSRSGIPFFYLVFPPHILESFPASYFATAALRGEDGKRVESALAARYPNVIPIKTESIVAIATTFLETVVTIVFVVGLPASLLGVLLIIVMLWQSLYERANDMLVFRVFGYTRIRTLLLFCIETGIVSLIAGGVYQGFE
jgi:putative ABC transport system permease protein